MKIMIEKEVHLRISDIICGCEMSISEENLESISKELYDRLSNSRRCTFKECTNQGMAYENGTWRCEDHNLPPCDLCGQGIGSNLKYSDILICNQCLNEEHKCCITHKKGSIQCCGKKAEFIHTCREWICRDCIETYINHYTIVR